MAYTDEYYELLKPKPWSSYYTKENANKTVIKRPGQPDLIYIGEGDKAVPIRGLEVGPGIVGQGSIEDLTPAQREAKSATERNPYTGPATGNHLKYLAIQGLIDNQEKKLGGRIKGQWDTDDLGWYAKTMGVTPRNLEDAEKTRDLETNQDRWNADLRRNNVRDVDGNLVRAQWGDTKESIQHKIDLKLAQDRVADSSDNVAGAIAKAKIGVAQRNEQSRREALGLYRQDQQFQLQALHNAQQAAIQEEQFNKQLAFQKEQRKQEIIRAQAQEAMQLQQHQDNLALRRDQFEEEKRRYNQEIGSSRVNAGLSALMSLFGGIFA
tara:strand:+ start:365 stop:1333 length:969 start_codon:yes stop_codon:yes gene_type:complete